MNVESNGPFSTPLSTLDTSHDAFRRRLDWAVFDHAGVSAVGRGAGLDAALTGIDFLLNSLPACYREAVAFIKADPLSLGALITTHKVNLLKASRDLFDNLDPLAAAASRSAT
jgi:hypothetical protein